MIPSSLLQAAERIRRNKNLNLKKGPRELLAQLLLHINLDSLCETSGAIVWPSTQRLADILCCSRRSVISHMKALEKQGLIFRQEQQRGPKTGNYQAVRTVLLPCALSFAGLPPEKAAHGGVQKLHTAGCKSCAPVYNEEQSKREQSKQEQVGSVEAAAFLCRAGVGELTISKLASRAGRFGGLDKVLESVQGRLHGVRNPAGYLFAVISRLENGESLGVIGPPDSVVVSFPDRQIFSHDRLRRAERAHCGRTYISEGWVYNVNSANVEFFPYGKKGEPRSMDILKFSEIFEKRGGMALFTEAEQEDVDAAKEFIFQKRF